MVLFYSIIKLLILMGLQQLDSVPVIEISDSSAPLDIKDRVEYYEDKSGKLASVRHKNKLTRCVN